MSDIDYNYRLKKEKKESRLSFRILPEHSTEIDKLVKKFDKIKDRSHFGTLATNLYLQYLKEEMSIRDSMTSAVLKLAENAKASELTEIEQLKELIDRTHK